MSRRLLGWVVALRVIVLVLCAGASFARAQTASDTNSGLWLSSVAGTGTFTLSWWGQTGWTYFIQQSDDLVNWTYVPVIEEGSDAVIQWGFTSSNTSGFFQLVSVNIASSDPWDADFDGVVGMTNGEQLLAGLNPLDYFNGIAPILGIESGNQQLVGPGQSPAQALTVLVSNASGTTLVNAPVTFTMSSGTGLLAAASGSSPPWLSTVSTVTDANGEAAVLLQGGSTPEQETITVTAGKSTTTFTETVSNVDANGDGIPDWWEALYGISLTEPGAAFQDVSGNRVPNIWAYYRGTNPTEAGSVPTTDAIVDASLSVNSGNQYTTLQAAYDAMPAFEPDGVTPYYAIIEVKAGTYTAGVDGSESPKKVLWLADQGGQVILNVNGTAVVAGDDTVLDSFTIQGDALHQGTGIVVSPAASLAGYTPTVRLVDTIMAGCNASAAGSAGAILNNGGNLWLVESTLVQNIGALADAILNQTGTVHLFNSVVGVQASGNPTQSVVDQAGGGTTDVVVQSSIITGMAGAWGSNGVDPLFTDAGHITAWSPARGLGAEGAGVQWDIHGEPRPTGAGADLGAEQWVDTSGNGLPDWYTAQNSLGSASASTLAPNGLTYLQNYLLGINPNASGASVALQALLYSTPF